MAQQKISTAQAKKLTDDDSPRFEEKLLRYGFQASDMQLEPKSASPSAPTKTKWRRLAEQLDEQGFLDGRSDEAQPLLAEGRIVL